MAHQHRAVFAAVLAVGASGWLGSAAALAAPASTTPSAVVEHDTVAVIGTGTSTVQALDEHGNANQTKVDAADSQTAENDSTAQQNDTNIQEGDSGTHEDGTANDSTAQAGDTHVDQHNPAAPPSDTGTSDTGTANHDITQTQDSGSTPSGTNG